MSRLEKAREFRKRINANLQVTRKLIRVDDLTEEELFDMIDLYENYYTYHNYEVGEIFQYEGKLYKVIQEHTSQEDWIPSELPALYLSMMPENVIPEWVQPTGGHDAYNTGDKVIFEGDVYECIIDGNTWSPTDYPQGWELITL